MFNSMALLYGSAILFGHQFNFQSSMNILGMSAYYHDSAACLVRDGEVIGAAQEERFSRKKHDAGFPRHAIQFCLDEADVRLGQ